MNNNRLSIRTYGLIKAWFLVILLMTLVFTQFSISSVLLQLDLFERMSATGLGQLSSYWPAIGLVTFVCFCVCCLVWLLYRPFNLLWLKLKNLPLFSRVLYSRFMPRSPALQGRLAGLPDDHLWIKRLASRVARKLGVASPTIAIDSSVEINAKVSPDFFHPSLIILTQGLLDKLTPDEIEAVIAHELAHVKMQDTLSMSIIHLLMLFIIWLPVYVFHIVIDYGFLFKWRDKRIGFLLGLTLVVAAYALLPLLVFNAINRRHEFRADKLAVRFSNIQSFFSALKTVQTSQSQQVNPLEQVLSVLPEIFQRFIKRLFLSHPSVSSRLEALH